MVVDDTAVTPQYVAGVAAKRELPIIKKIAVGSLRNKILFILPAALLLSEFLPWLLTPLLMLGGTYLCYEGAEKVWEGSPATTRPRRRPQEQFGPEHEGPMVAGAIRTDFILSAEIMVIALNEVADEPFVVPAIILLVVAVAITILVYGVVAAIVKMDDVGLHLTQRDLRARPADRARPGARDAAAARGHLRRRHAAMLWVGGHILLVGVDDLGWHWPYDLVHHWEEDIHHAVGGIGSAARRGWSTPSPRSSSASSGAPSWSRVMHVLPFRKKAAAAH